MCRSDKDLNCRKCTPVLKICHSFSLHDDDENQYHVMLEILLLKYTKKGSKLNLYLRVFLVSSLISEVVGPRDLFMYLGSGDTGFDLAVIKDSFFFI